MKIVIITYIVVTELSLFLLLLLYLINFIDNRLYLMKKPLIKDFLGLAAFALLPVFNIVFLLIVLFSVVTELKNIG